MSRPTNRDIACIQELAIKILEWLDSFEGALRVEGCRLRQSTAYTEHVCQTPAVSSHDETMVRLRRGFLRRETTARSPVAMAAPLNVVGIDVIGRRLI